MAKQLSLKQDLLGFIVSFSRQQVFMVSSLWFLQCSSNTDGGGWDGGSVCVCGGGGG